MQRIGRFGKLKSDSVEEYLRLHKEMPTELIEIHNKAGIRNFSIYLHGLEIFSYLETDDWNAAYNYLMTASVSKIWGERMRSLLDEPLPWLELEEVFRID